MKLLSILEIPVPASGRQEFKDWFFDKTEERFNTKGASVLMPMACMLLHSGKTLMVFPNFENEYLKTEAMQQIRMLAKVSHCVAYGFVSEGYFKIIDQDDRSQLDHILKNLDGQVSLLPDRKECLICNVEIREGKSILRYSAHWIIEKGKLGKKHVMPDPDEARGRMLNILE